MKELYFISSNENRKGLTICANSLLTRSRQFCVDSAGSFTDIVREFFQRDFRNFVALRESEGQCMASSLYTLTNCAGIYLYLLGV